jgi:hypothetical protein
MVRVLFCGIICISVANVHSSAQFLAQQMYLTNQINSAIKPLSKFVLVMPKYKKEFIRRNWTKQEDDLLISATKRNGQNDWPVIAEEISYRTPRQCRERWKTYLNPEIKQTPWTRNEDNELLSAHDLHNLKWAAISRLLPGRTPTNIRNRYQQLKGITAKKTATTNPDDTPPTETNFTIYDFDDEIFNSVFFDL